MSRLCCLALVLSNLSFQFVLAIGFQYPLHQKAFQAFVQEDGAGFEIALQECERVLPDHPITQMLTVLRLSQEGGRDKRIQAFSLLEKLRPRWKDDAFFHFVEGYFLSRGRRWAEAIRAFTKALEIDPYFVEAMVELGNAYYQRMLEYIHRYTWTEIPLSFTDWAMEDYQNAENWLQKALSLNPSHYRAALILSFLYYELGHYRKIIPLLQRAIRSNPYQKDLYASLAMAYLKLRNYPKAEENFSLALRNMPPNERQFVQSYLALKNEYNAHLFRQVAEQNYWVHRDPLFLTRQNERFLEHLARFFYTELHFRVPALNIPGWQTDRGQVYLHYGAPRFIIHYGKTYGDNGEIYSPMEVWIYPNFQFAFEDEFWNQNYRFAVPDFHVPTQSPFRSRTSVNYVLEAQAIFNEVPEIYELDYPGGRFATQVELVHFWDRQKAQTISTLLWAVDLHQFQAVDSLEFETGFFLIADDGPKAVYHQTVHPFQDQPDILLPGRRFFTTAELVLPPGPLSGSFEVMEHHNQAFSVIRKDWTIRRFSNDSLQVSDVVLAYQIQPAPPQQANFRHRYWIAPNFSGHFRQDQRVYLYLEVYNLDKPVNGNAIYTLSITFRPVKKQFPLTALFRKSTVAMSLVNEYQSAHPDDEVMLALDISQLSPGEYSLEILVTDKIKGQRATRRKRLIVDAKW